MIPKNATTAAALVGGYLLGRTRKAKMAIGVGMFLAGRRLDLDPRRIGKLLAASPVAGALSEQVRRELFEATKSAATQALTKRASGLADSLQERTRALGRDDREDRDDTDTDDGRAVEDAADRDGDVDGDGDGDQESSRPAASAKSTAKRTTKSTAKSAAKKSTSRSSARSSSSGGSPRKATAARKRTSAPRKATASRTRKSRSDSDE
ncbi:MULTISPECIES: hypothetical protein [unclassified Streptomyces]|uniref:hypothetical protein n=1 Tax=Streptomyces sp. NPDC127129 TaxID=3345373 RepID=UPI00362E97F3